MVNISISEKLKALIPELVLSCIECDVSVSGEYDGLRVAMDAKSNQLSALLKVEDISQLPAIAASRRGYRACGKDPARYRLSAEALLRRVVQGKKLYHVNNVVDLLNLVSVSGGFSIGGYDAGQITGDVEFGIGTAEEFYEGIGRGMLNIENLPVFRDNLGAFGSPTSDSVRTSVTNNTSRFLMVIIDFGNLKECAESTEMAVDLLEKYAGATNFEIKQIE